MMFYLNVQDNNDDV